MPTAQQVQAQLDQQGKDYTSVQQQLQQAQARQQSLMAGMKRPGAAYNPSASSEVFALNNTINALNAKLASIKQTQSQTQGGLEGAQAQDKADAARQQMLGLGQQGIDQLKGDSTDAMIRNYLQGQTQQQTLDPNAKVFGNGVPQYNAQGYNAQGYQSQGYDAKTGSAAGYDPTTGTAQSWQAAQMGDPALIGGDLPWNAASKGAYMTDATDSAAGGESARNQMIRDAILQSGGNASDPALAGAYAESLSQRNDATSKAQNQLNMRVTSDNFNAQRQADLANQSAKMQQSQYNASNQQQANSSNANLAQQMGMANLSSQNQAGMFNAGNQQQMTMANMGAQNQAGQFNASAANQAGQFNAANQTQANQFGAAAKNQAAQFNVGNQMQGTMADFNAGRQAQQYNQQAQSGAANQLGSYNNQRQNMLQGAQQNQINLLGQQRFSTGQPTQPQQQFPSFQQFQSFGTSGGNNYAPGYGKPMTGSMGSQNVSTFGGTGSNGGFTTSSFGPTGTGTPIYQQASQYVNASGYPAAPKPQGLTFAQQKPGTLPLTPGYKPTPGLAPQIMKPINPYDSWN